VADALQEGIRLQQTGHLKEAEGIYKKILKDNPKDFDAIHLLGTLAYQVGKYELAINLIKQAIHLNPHNANFYNNCGPSLRCQGRYTEAIACYKKTLELSPKHPEAYYNLGKTYAEAGEPEKAIEAYDRQLGMYPEHLSARWNRCLANLLLGNFVEGWRDYEIRWEATPASLSKRKFSIPQWKGESLAGKKLFIYAEQGLGDTIQFIRYASLAAERGAYVYVQCQKELVRLIELVPGIQKVITENQEMPVSDFQIPMMSLPFAFKTQIETIPQKFPYISVDTEEAMHWQTRLQNSPSHDQSSTKMNVGIVWAGGPKHPNDAQRSLHIKQLAPLAEIEGVRWISLQKGEPSGQILDAPFPILDWTSELHDFKNTAALISELDAVIAVDTSVAHLAGALNKPVWLLLTYVPDFRWLMRRNDSPWYPNTRLFRQKSHRDWNSAIQDLASYLLRNANTSRK
jgi:tetratricopeptide (TPR) repeat protein